MRRRLLKSEGGTLEFTEDYGHNFLDKTMGWVDRSKTTGHRMPPSKARTSSTATTRRVSGFLCGRGAACDPRTTR